MSTFTEVVPGRKAGEPPDRPAGLTSDPELLNALLGHWRPYLLAVARRRMGLREVRKWNAAYDADDVVQEVLLRAARHVRKYDPARGTFKTFLCLFVDAICLELFSHQKRQGRSPRPAVGFCGRDRLARVTDRRAGGPLAAAEENDFWADVGRDLDAGERATLRLRFRDGLMRDQVAERLGVTRHAAEWRFRTLRRKLKADPRFRPGAERR